MAEEKEHMMMPKKDMDEDQLMWWNDTKVDIMERKRQLHGESSTLRGESLMSGWRWWCGQLHRCLMFACVLGDGSGAKILVFGGAMK
jgi:hypothetical protein